MNFDLTLITLLALCGYVLAFIAACHALLTKRDPQAGLGWVALLLLVPYVGTVIYLLFGVSRLDSRAARLMSLAATVQIEAENALDESAVRPARFMAAVPHVLSQVGLEIAGNEPVHGNTLTLLCNGEEAYPQMLEAIDQAQHQVYLSTYIFKGGQSGNAFADALARAAARGVDTRLIVDGLGGTMYCRHAPWEELDKRGVKVERFLPVSLFPPAFNLNLRTHRKVLVCDARVGFTGGMNIGDHHLLELSDGKEKVQDIHFRCVGPVAAALQEAFLMDWAFVSRQTTSVPALPIARHGSSPCRLIFDGLGKDRDDIHELLCGVISGAQKHVRVMTPYFLPPRELLSALTSASMRGVQVDIILPQVNNLPYVHYASLHMQPRLLREGVHIYWQPAPFAHTKLLLVDDSYVLMGSANLDSRSLFLNFELNMEVFDPVFSSTMIAYFKEVQSRSHEAAPENYMLALPLRLRNAACWLFSPYL